MIDELCNHIAPNTFFGYRLALEFIAELRRHFVEQAKQLADLKQRLELKPGGCRIVSLGDACDCTLCKQSNMLVEQAKQLTDLQGKYERLRNSAYRFRYGVGDRSPTVKEAMELDAALKEGE